MINVQEIKKKIPHGGIKEIAKRCKVHYMTAIAVFEGNRSVSERTKAKVMLKTAEYLQELKEQREKAEEILKAI